MVTRTRLNVKLYVHWFSCHKYYNFLLFAKLRSRTFRVSHVRRTEGLDLYYKIYLKADQLEGCSL